MQLTQEMMCFQHGLENKRYLAMLLYLQQAACLPISFFYFFKGKKILRAALVEVYNIYGNLLN